jgi:hypothetical protein
MERDRELFLECCQPILPANEVNPVEIETGFILIEKYFSFLTYSSLKTKIKAEEKLTIYVQREFERKPIILTIGGFGLIGRWAIPVVGYPVLLSWTKTGDNLLSVCYPELNSLKKKHFHKFKTTPFLTELLSSYNASKLSS